MTQNIFDLGAKYGYSQSMREGFVGMARVDDEGITSRFDVFFWSNVKAADEAGIPRAYIVLDFDGDRYRLPQVDWPSEKQPRRSWEDIEEEFDTVFGPLLTLPDYEKSMYRAQLDADPRYTL